MINKFDIHDGQQLNIVEREISIVKAAVLSGKVTGKYDKMDSLIRKCIKEELA